MTDGGILITGAAGFIGTNFVYQQLKDKPSRRIVCLDSLTYAGNVENLEPALKVPRVRFVKGNVVDRGQMERLFREERFQAVVHFAAESHVDRSIENPELFLRTNVFGTQVLLDVCRANEVERFHMVSTDEVYGDLPLNRPDLLFDEDSPLRPSSPYSASKAAADLFCLAYHRTYGLPVTISRCSNNYGPYQFPEKLIPRMITLALQNLPLPIYGNGNNVRDWLYVDDHCRAIDLILEKGKAGEVYNIGGNNERRNIDVAKLILKELGRPESLITFVRDRPGHDLRYAIDASKAKRELGWMPEHSFDEGIRETVRWYLEHQDWLERVASGDYLKANEAVRLTQ
jgi:dTDP-glucose 4,6-dehydratase